MKVLVVFALIATVTGCGCTAQFSTYTADIEEMGDRPVDESSHPDLKAKMEGILSGRNKALKKAAPVLNRRRENSAKSRAVFGWIDFLTIVAGAIVLRVEGSDLDDNEKGWYDAGAVVLGGVPRLIHALRHEPAQRHHLERLETAVTDIESWNATKIRGRYFGPGGSIPSLEREFAIQDSILTGLMRISTDKLNN